jgi:sugar lactone lactonase YvrE
MRGMWRLALAITLAILCGPIPTRAQNVQPVLSGVFSQPVGVVLDAFGNAYVADNSSGAITKIAPNGAASLFMPPGSFDFPAGLAFDKQGNLYVANGGSGSVSEVSTAGAVSTFVASGLGVPAGLAFDASGNLYVADSTGDAIFEVTPDGVAKTFAGNSALIATPQGLAFDAAGNLYVANLVPTPLQGAITKITPDGTPSTFAKVDDTDFLFPTYLAFDATGTLYASSSLGALVAIDQGGQVTVLDTLPFVSAQGIAADRAGNLYIADIDAMTLSKRSAAGKIATLAGNVLAVPEFATTDPAGNLYIANSGNKTVTKVTPQGVASVLVPRGGPIGDPVGVVFGPDNVLYVADDELDQQGIYKVAADGTATLLASLSSLRAEPQGMAFDSHGTLYVSDSSAGAILKVAPDGTVSTWLTTALDISLPEGLVFDPAGNLVIANAGFGNILKAAPDGTVSIFVPASVGLSAPQGVAFDGNGTLYVANSPGGTLPVGILAVTPDGKVEQYATGVAGLDNPIGLTYQAPGLLYAADSQSGSLFSLSVPVPSATPAALTAAVLPGSRSVQLGSTATVFGTLINTGSTALGNCTIGLQPGSPAGLAMSFQATDPSTNQPIGQPNQAVTIAANALQSFVLGFQSSVAQTIPAYAPVFGCDGSQPAPTLNGVDTVSLDFSATPVADIIALAATAQPGVVQVPLSQQQAGAFAVATVNVGAGAALTVTTDTGAATLPLSILLCQTDPNTAACLQPMAPSVPLTIAAGATPTFSVFITATGPVAFAPGSARIFVRFLDADGQSHGSTSVAVETD